MRPFLTSDDVMAITGYSRSQAYLIISELNRELKKQGYMTRRGCVPSRFFCKKYFVDEDQVEEVLLCNTVLAQSAAPI